VRVVPKGSAELKIFETFFESGWRSGQIRDTQRDYLFGGVRQRPVLQGVADPLIRRGSPHDLADRIP
jgi:hypothetical protein